MPSITKTISSATVHGRYPIMYFSGDIIITRATDDSASVTVQISATDTANGQGFILANTGYESYGTPYSGVGMRFSANSTEYSAMHGNYYNFSPYSYKGASETWSVNWTSGSLTIYANCYFGSSYDTSPHCDRGYEHTALWTFDISQLPYKPYKTPTISISGATYSKHNASRSVSIAANTSGDSSATRVQIKVGGESYVDVTSGGSNISNNARYIYIHT